MLLEDLEKEVVNCNKCGLAHTRNNVIFGEGNNHAPIVIIGEAPGKDEDLQGRPFVGHSGQLLDKFLAACGFNRTHHVMPVYHPSALLRNPALKRDTWEDFKKIVIKYRQIIDHSHYSAHI